MSRDKGIHINCFAGEYGIVGELGHDHDEERVNEAIANFSNQIIRQHGIETSMFFKWNPCLNEITAVKKVLSHLEEYGEYHMEYLVMFRCDGSVMARGQKFIGEVLKYAKVMEARS